MDDLSLISLEAAHFRVLLEEADRADTDTARLEALNAALQSAFGVVELVGRLRGGEYPEWAEPLSLKWRNIVLDVRDMQADICRSRLAGLSRLRRQ
jgi:hypothetical protein